MKKMTTKDYFEESLIELSRSKSFSEISVLEIVQRSGMSARTFYNHFDDKYDLILWTFTSKLKRYFDDTDAFDFETLFCHIAEILIQQKKLYLNAFEDMAGNSGFLYAVSESTGDIVLKYLKEKFYDRRIPSKLDFSVKVLCHGGFYLGYRIMSGELKMTREDYLMYISDNIENNIKEFFPEIHNNKKM